MARLKVPGLALAAEIALSTAFDRIWRRLEALEKRTAEPAIVTGDFFAREGQFVRVQPTSAGLTLTLPTPRPSNRGAVIRIGLETGGRVRFTAVGGLVNGYPFVTSHGITGTFDAVSDGESGWSIGFGLTPDGPLLGKQGPPGAPGHGEQGEQGEQGIPGQPGATGAAGAAAPPGIQGDPGEAGDMGVPGAPGAPGAAGGAGSPGTQGEPGEPGEQGVPGTPGAPGAAGAPAPPGTQGEPGEPGEQGIPGTPGAAGAAGSTGTPGTQGDTGEPGEQGVPGQKGDKGDKGDPGEQGPPGNDGADGADGERGAQGRGLDDLDQSRFYGRAELAGFGPPTPLTPTQAVAIIDGESPSWTGNHSWSSVTFGVTTSGDASFAVGDDLLMAATGSVGIGVGVAAPSTLTNGFFAVVATGDIWLQATSGIGLFAGHTAADVAAGDIVLNATSGIAIVTDGATPVVSAVQGIRLQSGTDVRVFASGGVGLFASLADVDVTDGDLVLNAIGGMGLTTHATTPRTSITNGNMEFDAYGRFIFTTPSFFQVEVANDAWMATTAGGIQLSTLNAGVPTGVTNGQINLTSQSSTNITANTAVTATASSGSCTLTSSTATCTFNCATSFVVNTNSVERLEILTAGAWEVAGDTGKLGHIFRSTGTAAPPIWTSPSSIWTEDFQAGVALSGYFFFTWRWEAIAGSIQPVLVSGRRGVMRIGSVGAAAGVAGAKFVGNDTVPIANVAGFRVILRIVDVAGTTDELTQARYCAGLVTTASDAELGGNTPDLGGNGLVLMKLSSSAFWQARRETASAADTLVSAVTAVVGTWVEIDFVNNGGGSWAMSINGTLVGSITGVATSGDLIPVCWLDNDDPDAADAKQMEVDLFEIYFSGR